jgi:hypothetical protein
MRLAGSLMRKAVPWPSFERISVTLAAVVGKPSIPWGDGDGREA